MVAISAVATAATSGRFTFPWLVFVAWVSLGLGCEIVDLVWSLGRSRNRGVPAGATPPDGIVGFFGIPGLRGIPNVRDARFRRFSGFEGADAELGSKASITRRAPAMLGRVVLVSLFVGKNGTRWSDEEIANALASLEKAGSWLEKEAIAWGAPINFDVLDTYFEEEDEQSDAVDMAVVAEGDGTGLFEARAVENAMAAASRAVTKLRFHGVAEWIDRIGSRIQPDATIWILHVRSAGRSHAIPELLTPLPGRHLAVCYARYADFPSPLIGPASVDSLTYAHEILHLFGATDKYKMPLSRFRHGTVSDRDIMRLSQPTLARSRIEGLTASEIGWATGAQRSRR
jgi:hypothetical protein